MKNKFPQPCSACGVLTRAGSRCETHQREYDKQRNANRRPSHDRQAHKSQLYNYAYRQEAKKIKETATHCHICGKAFRDGDRIEADHIIPGLIGGPLAPAHRECNQRRGNRSL